MEKLIFYCFFVTKNRKNHEKTVTEKKDPKFQATKSPYSTYYRKLRRILHFYVTNSDPMYPPIAGPSARHRRCPKRQLTVTKRTFTSLKWSLRRAACRIRIQKWDYMDTVIRLP